MNIINSIITFLAAKPAAGAGISGGSFVGGLMLNMGVTPGLHEIINNCLQTAAFLVTLVVGILTVVSWLRKNKKHD